MFCLACGPFGFYPAAQVAPHHGEDGFRNNYPHPAKESFWRWKWEQLGGWVVEGAGLKLIHTGDLGYSRDAVDIGERLGPFDLAFIPIGAYAPRWFMKTMHVDVPEAIQVRADLRAARAIGMHWGTFESLTDELDG